jgi:hypothetical protein
MMLFVPVFKQSCAGFVLEDVQALVPLGQHLPTGTSVQGVPPELVTVHLHTWSQWVAASAPVLVNAVHAIMANV